MRRWEEGAASGKGLMAVVVRALARAEAAMALVGMVGVVREEGERAGQAVW